MNYDVTAFFHFLLLIPLKLKKCYYSRYVSEIEPLIRIITLTLQFIANPWPTSSAYDSSATV